MKTIMYGIFEIIATIANLSFLCGKFAQNLILPEKVDILQRLRSRCSVVDSTYTVKFTTLLTLLSNRILSEQFQIR